MGLSIFGLKCMQNLKNVNQCEENWMNRQKKKHFIYNNNPWCELIYAIGNI